MSAVFATASGAGCCPGLRAKFRAISAIRALLAIIERWSDSPQESPHTSERFASLILVRIIRDVLNAFSVKLPDLGSKLSGIRNNRITSSSSATGPGEPLHGQRCILSCSEAIVSSKQKLKLFDDLRYLVSRQRTVSKNATHIEIISSCEHHYLSIVVKTDL